MNPSRISFLVLIVLLFDVFAEVLVNIWNFVDDLLRAVIGNHFLEFSHVVVAKNLGVLSQ